jgi:hypothetical protein
MWSVDQQVTVQAGMAAVAVDFLRRVTQGAETTRAERVGKASVMSRHFNYWIHSGWLLFVFIGVPLTFRDNSSVSTARRIMMGCAAVVSSLHLLAWRTSVPFLDHRTHMCIMASYAFSWVSLGIIINTASGCRGLQDVSAHERAPARRAASASRARATRAVEAVDANGAWAMHMVQQHPQQASNLARWRAMATSTPRALELDDGRRASGHARIGRRPRQTSRARWSSLACASYGRRSARSRASTPLGSSR